MTVRPLETKIFDRAELVERFGTPRDRTIVFTNGVFDLLHPGHAAYLLAARSMGDALVVGVNSDASARRLAKGPGRPVSNESDRLRMLAALESVDAVCLFDDDTPLSLIEAVLPDVLVKGGDYTIEGVVGREVVEAGGGRVELIPFVDGYSTTDLVRRIKDARE